MSLLLKKKKKKKSALIAFSINIQKNKVKYRGKTYHGGTYGQKMNNFQESIISKVDLDLIHHSEDTK